ncbi:hypothetical protein [Pontibacter harenae]|uniref:hypothetical protein n=1 Tax=Pontibacter harenae TaxID=2894083 RepID=UPI001E50F7CD|nr:hypothetical protein [Pontibacter harenae]MCC9167946.1 hypothetical protein [Pontibacter harenae]
MKNLLKYSATLLLLVLIIASCRKEPEYSEVPEIEFSRVEQYHYERFGVLIDSLHLVIGYRDGDGNLGLSTEQNSSDMQPPFEPGSPYYNNFRVDLFRQNEQGQFVPYEFPVEGFTLSSRFPRISADDRNEPLEGEIKFKLEFSSDIFRPGDVIQFHVSILDRTRPVPNISNVAVSRPVTLFTE